MHTAINSLATVTAGRITFNRSAIMAWAHHEGRNVLRFVRTAAERRAALSHWLRRAWAEARKVASFLRADLAAAAEVRAIEASRKAASAKLAASYGSAAAIRAELAAEASRDFHDAARVARLTDALRVAA